MKTMTRRGFIKTLGAAPLFACLPKAGTAEDLPDISALKVGYAQRLKNILSTGALPYIDIESSCNPSKVDIDSIAQSMEQLNIGLMALSADIGKGQFAKGVRFDKLSERLVARYPDRFISVGNGCQPPVLTEAPDDFLDAQEALARKKQIALFGEYEFRHYPSPRQVKRGDMDRDVNVPIDGPAGHRLFSLSENTGLPLQIHYEVEDKLLAPLEKMLEQYPNARVIWCHFAQIRYIERASRYTPTYVDGLLARFPKLYFDTAFGDASSVYPPSNQRHARVWTTVGGLNPEWCDLIVAHPRRFLSALDLGQDRLDKINKYDKNHRTFLNLLPIEIQHQVAYRNARLLLFGEEFA